MSDNKNLPMIISTWKPKTTNTVTLRLPLAARGELIKTTDELLELAREKKSIYWSGPACRMPAAVIINWSLSMVSYQIENKNLYRYVCKSDRN